MDYLRQKLRVFNIFYKTQPKDDVKREITRYEWYMEWMYKILIWHDAAFTLTVFLGVNFIFWLVIQLELPLLGILFLTLLVLVFADTFLEHSVGFSMEHPHIELFDEFYAHTKGVYGALKLLRKENPSAFCIAACTFCLLLSFIARNVSGQLLTYLGILTVFFGPLALEKIPPQYLDYIKQLVRSLSSEKGVLAEDELIPYISNKDFNNRDPDLDSLLTDKTQESVTNSLIGSLNAMPSYLEADDRDFPEEEDLLPKKSISGLNPDTSDSDSDHRAMKFESSHFNGDSSSEEEAYSKNLKFPNVDTPDAEQNFISATTATISNLMNVGSLFRMAVSTPARKDSSSESEFEMINEEDAQ